MDQCCGTCTRWKQESQDKRPKSLRTMFNGICELGGEKKAKETCWHWKSAEREEVARRTGEEGTA